MAFFTILINTCFIVRLAEDVDRFVWIIRMNANIFQCRLCTQKIDCILHNFHNIIVFILNGPRLAKTKNSLTIDSIRSSSSKMILKYIVYPSTLACSNWIKPFSEVIGFRISWATPAANSPRTWGASRIAVNYPPLLKKGNIPKYR